MIIDANIAFKAKRAANGDKIALCELMDYYADLDDWIKCCKFLEILVENNPAECEKIFFKITKDWLPYENMLGLIAYNCLDERNDHNAFVKWGLKYLDYLEFKHSKQSKEIVEKLKKESRIYQVLEFNNVHNCNEYRFWLEWEREHFIKSSPH